MTFINYILVSNVLLRTLLAENRYASPGDGYFKTICSLKKFSQKKYLGFGQLFYTFKDEKVSLNDLFYNGVKEFNELQNTKYDSTGLKITLPERQLNVLLKLFKQTSKTMQKTNKIKQHRHNFNFRGYSLSYNVCNVIGSQIYIFFKDAMNLFIT